MTHSQNKNKKLSIKGVIHKLSHTHATFRSQRTCYSGSAGHFTIGALVQYTHTRTLESIGREQIRLYMP